MSKPHLRLVSDFPIPPVRARNAQDDFVMLLQGWQIAIVMSCMAVAAMTIGVLGGIWLAR
jgi:hypothetical protein